MSQTWIFSLTSLLYVLHKALSTINEVNSSVKLLYRGNLGYLVTNVLLALETHIFTLIALAILSRSLSGPSPEEEEFEGGLKAPLSLLKYSLIAVYYLMWHRGRRKVRVDEYYLFGFFIAGVVSSLTLIAVYEVNHLLFWSLFATYLSIIVLYIIALSEISEVKACKGITYEGNYITLHWGRNGRVKVNERTVALGLSVGTGICGIT